mmetsp:Transcript_34185/g.106366  ORF Transcript_34185/g.106366 Transcript_34185/m.106366 type:complete len:356 (+) Transcript_34185:1-1068(+)
MAMTGPGLGGMAMATPMPVPMAMTVPEAMGVSSLAPPMDLGPVLPMAMPVPMAMGPMLPPAGLSAVVPMPVNGPGLLPAVAPELVPVAAASSPVAVCTVPTDPTDALPLPGVAAPEFETAAAPGCGFRLLRQALADPSASSSRSMTRRVAPPPYLADEQIPPAPKTMQRGPPFGQLHRFHEEIKATGHLSEDGRHFTKEQFKGRLSVITEDEVHSQGVHKYVVTFTGGELSSADGVGFIFSSKLPCPKNIQRIVSIFANRTGRICVRAHSEVVRSDIGVKQLEIGDTVAVTIDLDRQIAEFAVWPAAGGRPSTASVAFGAMLQTLRKQLPSLAQTTCGYFACVVKHVGVQVALGS